LAQRADVDEVIVNRLSVGPSRGGDPPAQVDERLSGTATRKGLKLLPSPATENRPGRRLAALTAAAVAIKSRRVGHAAEMIFSSIARLPMECAVSRRCFRRNGVARIVRATPLSQIV